MSELKYYPEAVSRAVKKLRSDGVNIKTLCTSINSAYYTKLYDKMGKRAMIPASFLEPIMERHPVFRQYLGAGVTEDPVSESVMDKDVTDYAVNARFDHQRFDRIDQKIDQLTEEVREYRRLLDSQLQANATLQRDKDSITKDLIDLLKKRITEGNA
jgi:predicted esterase YcpF (UPF0227 family)